MAQRKPHIDDRSTFANALHVGVVGQDAHLGAALHDNALRSGCFLKQFNHGGMRDNSVQRPSTMEGIEAYTGTNTQLHAAALTHAQSVGRQHDIDPNRNVRRQGPSGNCCAPEVEFLLDGRDNMHGRATAPAGK